MIFMFTSDKHSGFAIKWMQIKCSSVHCSQFCKGIKVYILQKMDSERCEFCKTAGRGK